MNNNLTISLLMLALLSGCESKLEIKTTSSVPLSALENAPDGHAPTRDPPEATSQDEENAWLEPISSLDAEVVSAGEIRLNWNVRSEKVSTFRLVHAPGIVAPASCVLGSIVEIPAGQLSYVVDQLEPARAHAFRICAKLTSATSPWSSGLTPAEEMSLSTCPAAFHVDSALLPQENLARQLATADQFGERRYV